MIGEHPDGRLALIKKLLLQIRANTESQGRLITKRQMTGLGRLLRERTALIAAAGELYTALRKEPGGLTKAEALALTALWQQAAADCSRVAQQALAERARIAFELKRSRTVRQAKNSYLDGWRKFSCGRQLNIKG